MSNEWWLTVIIVPVGVVFVKWGWPHIKPRKLYWYDKLDKDLAEIEDMMRRLILVESDVTHIMSQLEEQWNSYKDNAKEIKTSISDISKKFDDLMARLFAPRPM